jgi:uracil-DNA glycosylase
MSSANLMNILPQANINEIMKESKFISKKWYDLINPLCDEVFPFIAEGIENYAIQNKYPSLLLPQAQNIFRIFKVLDPEDIKIVLLGQDPYPEMLKIDEKQIPRACGFSFSSPLGRLPKSLNIIFKEICGKDQPVNQLSGDLTHWISDGVFLLNSFLTIQYDNKLNKGISGSHSNWPIFTTQILSHIQRINPNVVYLAFGNEANKIYTNSRIRAENIIHVAHPASRFRDGHFLGSKVFERANKMLLQRELEEIDWSPMEKSVDIEYFKMT